MISENYPIDFVIPWVDGSDPAWLAEKNQYSGVAVTDANNATRFRDWNLMKYWFRAIEKNAPWHHKLYFVTWGHIPDFLNPNAEKLEIVTHKEFIPREYLPTFSSEAIETNLFRIPGLSEHYVLFNDDCYLLRPMDRKKFFVHGLPCCYYAELPFIPSLEMGMYGYHVMNDIGVVNRHFSKAESYQKSRAKYYSEQSSLKDFARTWIMEKLNPGSFSGFKYFHSANPYLKSVLETIWEKEFDVMDATGRAHFRSPTDVNQCVALFWQLASGQFEPSKIDNLLKPCTEDCIDDISKAIKGQTHDMLCLSDSVTDVDVDSLSQKIAESFEVIFPEKSHFEK